MNFFYLLVLFVFCFSLSFSQDTLRFKVTEEYKGEYLFEDGKREIRINPYVKIGETHFRRKVLFSDREYVLNFINLNNLIDLSLKDSLITRFAGRKFKIRDKSFELVLVSNTHFKFVSNDVDVLDCYLVIEPKVSRVDIFTNESDHDILESLIALSLSNMPYRIGHLPKPKEHKYYMDALSPYIFIPSSEPRDDLRIYSKRKSCIGIGLYVFPLGTSHTSAGDEPALGAIVSIEYEHFLNPNNSIAIRAEGSAYRYGLEESPDNDYWHGLGIGLGFSFKHFFSSKPYRGFFVSPSLDAFYFKETYRPKYSNGLQSATGDEKSILILPNFRIGYRINLGDVFSITPALFAGFRTGIILEEKGTLKALGNFVPGLNVKLSWRLKASEVKEQ